MDPTRVLCIGDGVATDVLGGNRQGLDVLFVASGIHGGEAIGEAGLDPAAVEALLEEAGAEAAYVTTHLTW